MRILDKTKTLFGTFIELPTPASIEIAAHAGWDFVVIDCEHAPISTSMLPGYLRAAEAAGIPAIVRVAMNNAEWLQAALDSGAAGVQIPQIASVDQAKSAVLNGLSSVDAQRGYRHALEEFIDWYCSRGDP